MTLVSEKNMNWQLLGLSLALSAALLVAAACTRPEEKGPAGATKLVIGQISPGTSQAPLFVAVDQGFFKNAGLDVTIQNLSGGTPSAMASFATGNVNMLAAASPELIEYSGKHVISGKMFGELADQNYDVVVARGITSIQQLKGKIIAVSGENGADQIYLKALLAANGMSGTDVTFIQSGGTANRLVALSAGSVQGIVISNANRDAAIKAGTILLKSGDSAVQVPGSMLFASSELINSHKAELQKFLAALGAAIKWMRDNPTAAAGSCSKGTGASVDACASAISSNFDPAVSSKYTWSSTNAINTDGIKSALAVMATVVPETKALTIADVVDSSIAGSTP